MCKENPFLFLSLWASIFIAENERVHFNPHQPDRDPSRKRLLGALFIASNATSKYDSSTLNLCTVNILTYIFLNSLFHVVEMLNLDPFMLLVLFLHVNYVFLHDFLSYVCIICVSFCISLEIYWFVCTMCFMRRFFAFCLDWFLDLYVC